MQFPGKDIIDQLDKVIQGSTASFEDGLPDVTAELMDILTEFVNSLAKNRTGTLKASVANLKAIVRFSNQLTKVLQSGEYYALTRDLSQAFTDVTTLTNQYFSTISDQFSVLDFYKEIRKQTVETTLSTMLETGLQTQYVAPVTKILQQSITGQATSKEAIASLRTMLPQAPARWAQATADDAINQYARQYTQIISDDLELDHFLYSGTQIDSTRTFCQSKVGKVFTKAEVLDWTSQEWSGKNPATNAGNIQILLGGYRCRHRLIPITSVAYRQLKG